MFILIFIAILAILILVHEFGHFIVAKRLGIRVDEFGLGFPPRIFGEDPDAESMAGPDASRSFVNKPRWAQAAVLVAGVGFNMLFAWALISAGFMAGIPSLAGDDAVGEVKDAHVEITMIEPGSPADTAGFQFGDRILALEANERSIRVTTVADVQEFIAETGATPITIEYERDGISQNAIVTPVEGIVADRPAVGIAMDVIGVVQLPPHKAIYQGAIMTGDLFVKIIAGFGTLISDAVRGKADLAQVSGPVGIAVFVGDVAQSGLINLVSFVAFISVNLAVINLLPFPALDGGRLLFVVIESIKRSPINPTVANTVNAIGFAILIGLMLVVTYGDIVKLL